MSSPLRSDCAAAGTIDLTLRRTTAAGAGHVSDVARYVHPGVHSHLVHGGAGRRERWVRTLTGAERTCEATEPHDSSIRSSRNGYNVESASLGKPLHRDRVRCVLE